MEIKQIYTPGLAQLSYVVGGQNACFVIDPVRNIDQYIQIADSLHLPIAGIFETHLHADFVSGHLELAEKTGAPIYLAKNAKAHYPHQGLEHGEELMLDVFSVKLLNTPGHTPESSVFVFADTRRDPFSIAVFSGDTLFVGDVGRPDLFPDLKECLASSLYDSLRIIESLGDHLEVYPGHGAGSLCGKRLSNKLTSTIGIERMYNEPMKLHPKEVFIETLLKDMPVAPDHFSRCSAINRQGPAAVSSLPKIKPLSPAQFDKLANEGHLIVDTRSFHHFASAHIENSYAISAYGNFPTFAGWILPPDKPILLVCSNENELTFAQNQLRNVGLDNIVGNLKSGIDAWIDDARHTAHYENITVHELKRQLEEEKILLVDTRNAEEYHAAHIQGAVSIPTHDMRTRYAELQDESRPIAFICSSGYRSLTALSLFLQHVKDKKIYNVLGAMPAWTAVNYPTTTGLS